MSKHFDKLLKTLKTRQDVTALGFSKDELKSLASDIDVNLESLEETATDEDVENKIKGEIDNVIPMLKLAQMQASRIVAKKLKEQEDAKAADEEEKRKKAEEEAAAAAAEEGKDPNKGNQQNQDPATKKEDDELKSLIKSLNDKLSKQEEAITKQNETIANLMKGNVKEKRKAIVDAKLKDAGTLGKTYKRMFEKLNFEDDAQFEEFLEQIDEDIKDYNQDVANKLLEKQNPTPPANPGKKENEDDKVEVMSDEEIDGLVDDD